MQCAAKNERRQVNEISMLVTCHAGIYNINTVGMEMGSSFNLKLMYNYCNRVYLEILFLMYKTSNYISTDLSNYNNDCK